MSHTETPWAVYKDGKREMSNITCFIKSTAGDLVTYGHLSEEDATRIVACVNACAGISDIDLAALAGTSILDKANRNADEVAQQRDELLVACKAVDTFFVFFDSWTPPHLGAGARQALSMVRAAITKANT